MTPDFSRSTQTIALIEALQAAPIGAVLTYAYLSEVLGEDVQSGASRYHLYSAMRAVQAEHGIIFGTVRKTGIKRLAAEELPAIGDAALLHIRRASRKARKRMGVVNKMNDAPNEVRVKINAAASLLGAIEHFTGGKQLTKAAEVAKVSNTTVPPMALVEALKG